MRTGFGFVVVAAVALLGPSTVRGQSTAPPSVARGSAPAASHDQPFDPHDLSGIWWGHNARGVNSSLGATAPPMTPWAQERYDAAKPGLGRTARAQPLGNDPMMICDPMGFPRIMFWTNYP